jgi:hypothetical protein
MKNVLGVKKIYIASTYADRHLTAKLAAELEKMGFMITRKWWEDAEFGFHTDNASSDMDGVMDADLLICYNSARRSEGKLMEIGMALALGTPVIVLGRPIRTIFKFLMEINGTGSAAFGLDFFMDLIRRWIEGEME